MTRQLARSDALLHRIARRALRPIDIPLEADPGRAAVLSEEATAEKCEPVLDFWRAGPGFTADWLTSGKPPQDIIEASKVMRGMLRDWCDRALGRFPALAAPAATISLPLGAAMLRIGKPREAIEELTQGLAAPDKYRTDRPEEAIADYDRIIEIRKAPVEARLKALINRGALQARLQRHDAAIRDYGAVLGMRESTPRQLALALFNRADSKSQSGDLGGARTDYEAALAQPDLDEETQAEINRRLAALQGKSMPT